MMTRILCALGVIPTTVDHAIADITGALKRLENVVHVHTAKAVEFAQVAQDATTAAQAATNEAEKATRIHTAISALVA